MPRITIWIDTLTTLSTVTSSNCTGQNFITILFSQLFKFDLSFGKQKYKVASESLRKQQYH